MVLCACGVIIQAKRDIYCCHALTPSTTRKNGMDKAKVLQNLLKGKAKQEEIELLKRLLASGEISIGGNVNQSVIILGSGNTVEITSEALDRLGARTMLGNLE